MNPDGFLRPTCISVPKLLSALLEKILEFHFTVGLSSQTRNVSKSQNLKDELNYKLKSLVKI